MTESTPTSDKPKPKAKPTKLLMRQSNMQRMMYCLLAVLLSAIYFFGWRVLMIQVIVVAVGFATEFIMTRQRGKPVSQAVFVTCLLFGLSLPPTVPPLVAIVGVVVAVLFGKEVFGGFGRNFVNPAILGRAFVYVCFPIDLTGRFIPAFKGLPGGFARWSFMSLDRLPEYADVAGQNVSDAISMASPLWVAREFGPGAAATAEQASRAFTWWDLATGSIGGTFYHPEQGTRILSAGSMGEGMGLLIIACAIYLLWTRTANWRLMIPAALGLVITNLFWRHIAGFNGVGEVPPVWLNLFGGTTLYVLTFMVTDPVSAPKKPLAQIAYGALIGFFIVTLRWLGVFVAAATFSVLMGNLLGPLLDLGATEIQNRRKAIPPGTKEVGP